MKTPCVVRHIYVFAWLYSSAQKKVTWKPAVFLFTTLSRFLPVKLASLEIYNTRQQITETSERCFLETVRALYRHVYLITTAIQ